MAHGTTGNYNHYYFVEPRGKKDEWPYFRIQELNDGSFEDRDNASWVEGFITRIEFKQQFNKHKQANEDVVLLFLEDDGGEMNRVSLRFNSLGRNIMNSLIGIPQEDVKRSDRVKITLWQSKADDEGRQFGRASVYRNGERCEWGLDIEEVRELVDYVDTDEGRRPRFKRLNDRLYKDLHILKDTLESLPQRQAGETTPQKESDYKGSSGGPLPDEKPHPAETPPDLNEEDDDLPF